LELVYGITFQYGAIDNTHRFYRRMLDVAQSRPIDVNFISAEHQISEIWLDAGMRVT
jgi:hypothetical protein